MLSNATMALLNECAVRWRVHPGARVLSFSMLSDSCMKTDELGIQDLNEAFAVADYWNYPSWPNADVTIPAFHADMVEILVRPSAGFNARNIASRSLQSPSASI